MNNERTNLSLKNTVWSGMKLSSGEILGLVIYTGKETKISLNKDNNL